MKFLTTNYVTVSKMISSFQKNLKSNMISHVS